MLSLFEVLLFAFVALLLPLAVVSLIFRLPPPEGFLSKYYGAEKLLNPTGNLFLITVCLHAIARLAVHFGLIGAATADVIAPFIGVPFGVLLIAFLGLWVRAYFTVRRLENSDAAAGS